MSSRLQNNLLALVCLILPAASCNNRQIIPERRVNTEGNAFVQRQGITYLNGKAFSGWQYTLYRNGDTAMIAPYLNGRLEGVARSWYPGRRPKAIRNYHFGRKTGSHYAWYPDGQKKYIYHMLQDHYEGNVQEWYENGQLSRNCNYKNGQEEGMQTLYWPDGTIRANYQSINGRKYGLTGVKGCRSLWSADTTR